MRCARTVHVQLAAPSAARERAPRPSRVQANINHEDEGNAMIPQIDPQKAHDLMQTGHTYLDVRTVEEYVGGHAEGAVNVPAFIRDAMGQMAPNPEFLAVVQANFAPDT